MMVSASTIDLSAIILREPLQLKLKLFTDYGKKTCEQNSIDISAAKKLEKTSLILANLLAVLTD